MGSDSLEQLDMRVATEAQEHSPYSLQLVSAAGLSRVAADRRLTVRPARRQAAPRRLARRPHAEIKRPAQAYCRQRYGRAEPIRA